MKKIVFLALLIASGPLLGIAEGATIKVCPSGCAYTSIQTGIDAAADSDVVQVGDGTYHERIDFKNKAITVVSEHGAAATVIDGDRAGRVVTMTAPDGREAVLNGFTVQNGRISNENGGGVLARNAALLNCIVVGNSGIHGGGVYAASSRLAGCTLTGNGACGNGKDDAGRGGGILAEHSTVTGCTISGNGVGIFYYEGGVSGGSGGGVRASDSTFTNCKIFNNKADYGGGAGVSATRSTFVGCAITGNSGYESHYGSTAGGVLATDSKFERCTISSNYAGSCGGIVARNSKLIRCVISGNRSPVYGGVCADDSLLLNTMITGNTEGLYANGGEVVNCTIVNSGGTGINVGPYSKSPLFVVNSIVWGHCTLLDSRPCQIVVSTGATIDVSYSNVAGGWPGTGNLNIYPIFVTPLPASGLPTTAGDYHIWNGSPCIDRGRAVSLASSDFEGDRRPYGAGYDIGADEVVPRVTVKLPNGREVLKRGASYKIAWSRTVRSGTIGIALYKGSSRLRTIARSAPNTGYFLWRIPGSLPAGRDYRIRVYWNTNTRVSDMSDGFFTLR